MNTATEIRLPEHQTKHCYRMNTATEIRLPEYQTKHCYRKKDVGKEKGHSTVSECMLPTELSVNQNEQ